VDEINQPVEAVPKPEPGLVYSKFESALQVRPDDIVTVPPSSSAQQVIRDATDLVSTVASWLQADHDGLTGKVLKQPERGDIDAPVNEQLIVELYSK